MKKKVKYAAASLLFGVLLIGCGKFFRYILVDDTTSYTRITFHEMYEQENIDVLFVGSSHCFRSFIPKIFDEELEVNTFNVGTSNQSMDGSYMVIKEAARHHDIKHIYLELYYLMAFHTNKTRTNLTETYIISDYLKPSLDKVQYLLNASTKEHYPNSFILARRNWSMLFDADYVKNLLIKKGTDAYKNYEYTYVIGESDWYAGKGYVANQGIVDDWNYFSTKGWSAIDLDNIPQDWFHSLEDIITFCDKKGISLTLISAPMPNYLLAGAGNYDEYVKLVQSTIEGTNINYYDFNLCKEEYFPSTSSLFKDTNHLNCYGAETFSYLFADFINGKIGENELFYDSYEEKLKNLQPTVFGISYNDVKNDNEELIRNCRIVSTGNDDLEYEISLAPAEGESYKVQDFSDNGLFTIDPDTHGIITIAYRLRSLPDEVWAVNISY